MGEYILEMTGISKSFYGVQVLKDAQLHVRPGEVHVLLGENGAGKSTLIKILSGAYRREEGEILLDGEVLDKTTPKEILEAGVSVIYQEFNLVPHLPIYENIYLGKEFRKNGMVDKAAAIKEARRHMARIGLNVDPRVHINDLSVAQKQMVEIAKSISNDVKVLVLDEPTAAITDNETRMLFEIIRELKKEGIGIVYISHRMPELFEIGDRCTVMRDGEYVATVDMKDTNEKELTKLMVGREVSFAKVENKSLDTGKVVLEVENLSYKNVLHDISFQLHKGEIFALAGLVGAGRTELAKCMIGAYKPTAGKVIMHGEELKCSVCNSISKGMVYLSEDRKDEGLILMHSVMDNIALPNLGLFCKPLLRTRDVADRTQEYIQSLKIKTHSHLSEAKTLSGGNQQKVVIGKWLCADADIYIFDEPTRGIDVGARDEIYNIMHALLESGSSIIMISSDLVEVLKMCDRVAVMKEGRINTILENKDGLTQEQVLSYAL